MSPEAEAIGPASGEAIGTLEGEPLNHASLDPGDYRLLLDRNDFSVVTYTPDDPGCGGHTVWLARKRDVPPEPGTAPKSR